MIIYIEKCRPYIERNHAGNSHRKNSVGKMHGGALLNGSHTGFAFSATTDIGVL